VDLRSAIPDPLRLLSHWLHRAGDPYIASGTSESEKEPLENQVWNNYPPGQTMAQFGGMANWPTIENSIPRFGVTLVFFNRIGTWSVQRKRESMHRAA